MIGKKISHYRILEKLGGGGMGVVYKAEDLNLGRHVALKFLPPEVSSEEKRRKRFIHEAKAASSIDHPNLCTIHEIDQTLDGQMFISMAYYEGTTLRSRMDSSQLTLEASIDIALQIGSGLNKAHAHGIIHRDIKPANVIIVPGGLVKILDFGLAKLSGASQITEAETALGTISYMSPEQALGKTVDHRTDIWSWGIVLFEMLTGHLPFSYDNPLQFLNILLSNEPVTLNAIEPGQLRNVLAKTLAKDAEQRYASISNAISDLRGVKTSSQSLAQTSSFSTAHHHAETVVETEIHAFIHQQKPEKKPLTFLAAGITGYTELLEQIPIHEVNHFLDRFRIACEDLAASYHGIINEFDAERIVVIFGIPHAQENDFLTAVQFAFDLQSSLTGIASELCGSFARQVSLRAGIHSGSVLMQSSRSSGKHEISGMPLQVALALSSHAKANEIVVAQESRGLVRHSYGTRISEPIIVPGTSKSLSSYTLIQEPNPLEESFVAPYVGREKELRKLKDCLNESLDREGQFVALIGEAGVGKSRLLSEFKSGIRTEIRYLHGKCQPYGTTIPYAPFREVLQNALELQDEPVSAELLAHNIQTLDPALEDFIPLYLHLLSLQSERYPFPKHLEGENLRLAILDALSAFVLSSRQKSVVLVMEDWQWADEASENALKQIVDMLPEHRALLIVTYRPDSSIEWTGSHRPTQIYLEPLESLNVKALMQALFDAEDVTQTLAELVQDRTGGNPFFIEEICLNLKEEGKVQIVDNVATLIGSGGSLRLPETIQSLILSRLDRLDRSTREILQSAAVIGREFARGTIQHVAPDPTAVSSSLSALRSLGLIQQVRVLPEPTYKFRHALTHEVAYDSLLAHEKKYLHERVAEAIEALYSERIEENFDVLAHHYSHSDNWQKAVEFGMQSAKKVSALGQFTEALQILERAEEWLSKLPVGLARQQLFIDLMLQQERLCETLGIRNRQEQILNDLLSALKTTDDRIQQMEVYRRQGELLTLLSHFDTAESALNESLALSKDFRDLTGERNALRSLGFLKWHQGLNEEAVANNQKALEIDRERGDIEALAADLTNLGSVFRYQGDYRAALECMEESLRIYERINDPVKHAAALHLTGNVHRELGNPDQAMMYIQQAMAVSTRYRLVIMQSFHLNSIANMCWQQGKTEECLRLYHQAVELNRKSRHADGLAHSLRMVGETLEALQRQSEALPYLQEAATTFAQLKDQRNEAAVLTKIATVFETANDWNETLRTLERLKAISLADDNQKSTVEILQRMAKVSRQQEDLHGAIRYYRDAIGILETQGEEKPIAAILNSIAILEWKSGDYENALQDYERALEIFRSLGDDVHAGLILNSIGMTLKNMGRLEQALSLLQQAVEINRNTRQRKLEGHSLAAIAEIQSELGQVESAILNYQQALLAKRETADGKGEAWMLYHLARLQSLAGQEALSEEYRIETERMISDCGDQKLKDAWKELQLNMRKNEGGESA